MEPLTEKRHVLNFAAFNYSSSHHSVHLEWQGEYLPGQGYAEWDEKQLAGTYGNKQN